MAKPKLALIPAAQGTSLYSVLPSSGVGDFSFTRSGSATRINSQGLIETVASGVSRLNYPMIDGVVKGCPSHILEPQSTNLMTYSSDFSLYVLSSINLVSNIILSPDNSLTASKIYPTLSGNYRHIKWNPQSPASGLNTFSIFAKAGELEHLVLIDYDGSGAGVDYNLSTGVATDNSTNPFDSVEMIDYGNGWYRCIATATNAYFYYILSDNGGLSVTANGTDGLYIWGAQVEAQSYATSYIPTNGSTVTRSVETANGSGDASTFNDSEGVLMVEVSALDNDGTNRVISLSDGTVNNRLYLFYSSTSNSINTLLRVGGVGQFPDLSHTFSDITNFSKIAYKISSTEISLWANGIKVDSVTGSFSVWGANVINNLSFDGLSYEKFYGNAKQIQYFDSALNDNELETLTSWTSFTDMANGQLYSIK